MRKVIATVTSMLALLALVLVATPASADLCYNCGSGSSNGCKQCRAGGSDTSAARKACKAKGCKITGTSSCSSAANVKVCKVKKDSPWTAAQMSSAYYIW